MTNLTTKYSNRSNREILSVRSWSCLINRLGGMKRTWRCTCLCVSSISLTLKFSRGMIPFGSLSWGGKQSKMTTFLILGWFIFFRKSTYSCILEIVETAICQNEPPPFPGFNSTTYGLIRIVIAKSKFKMHTKNELTIVLLYNISKTIWNK